MGIFHNPALGHRPEIDGLRALAVLPVILFHSGLPLFSGGFVGVDIFFVISGYLITSIIIAEMANDRFSLINFYERRARRILPALFVVMLACLPVAWTTLDPPDLKYFAKSLVAVPTFSSNLLFWLESDYFDATAELKPLLHTWTLAVEEQYYLFFPLVLMLGWRMGQTRLVALLAIVAAASLTLAQLGARQDASDTFYLLHARAWELLAGSFIAFYFASHPHNADTASPVAQAAAVLGVLLIVYSVIFFDSSTPFPGFNALVPVLGATLIIVFANGKTWVAAGLAELAFRRAAFSQSRETRSAAGIHLCRPRLGAVHRPGADRLSQQRLHSALQRRPGGDAPGICRPADTRHLRSRLQRQGLDDRFLPVWSGQSRAGTGLGTVWRQSFGSLAVDVRQRSACAGQNPRAYRTGRLPSVAGRGCRQR
ncbi:Acyltransferase family protein [Pseudomonas syringae pv. maculicola]|nr:Acyltransferase family protein [Pseudomonas syringae pv. maculicola]